MKLSTLKFKFVNFTRPTRKQYNKSRQKKTITWWLVGFTVGADGRMRGGAWDENTSARGGAAAAATAAAISHQPEPGSTPTWL